MIEPLFACIMFCLNNQVTMSNSKYNHEGEQPSTSYNPQSHNFHYNFSKGARPHPYGLPRPMGNSQSCGLLHQSQTTITPKPSPPSRETVSQDLHLIPQQAHTLKAIIEGLASSSHPPSISSRMAHHPHPFIHHPP